jgi:uncharacterized damage-inducible protein DinB
MALNEALLPEFDAEMAHTRKTLERVPTDKFSWKPHERSGTMGWLANHLADVPEMHKMWSLMSNGATIIAMPRVACLRTWVMNHGIHHRAQLGVYLRLNSIAVPAIYGPSADEGAM